MHCVTDIIGRCIREIGHIARRDGEREGGGVIDRLAGQQGKCNSEVSEQRYRRKASLQT